MVGHLWGLPTSRYRTLKSVFVSLTIEIAAAEILIVQLEKEVLTEVYTIL